MNPVLEGYFSGNVVTNLAEHLRSKSQGDPGNVAAEVSKSLLVEISAAIGALVKYSEKRGMDRFRVATTKRSALLDYLFNKSDVVTAGSNTFWEYSTSV